MNGDVTVREVMERDFVGASQADTLADTAALMLEEHVEAVVVVRGNTPEGILTQEDVLEVAVGGTDLEEATVGEAMRSNPPEVSADLPLSAAVDRMSGASVRHLLVVDGDELVGLVSERDVVTASALGPGVDGESAPTPGPESEAGANTSETMAAETVGTTGTETTVDEEYSNQGICEVCGSLTRDLSSFNGQLVCNDCKDV